MTIWIAFKEPLAAARVFRLTEVKLDDVVIRPLKRKGQLIGALNRPWR